jgi:Rieske Fe-S protein
MLGIMGKNVERVFMIIPQSNRQPFNFKRIAGWITITMLIAQSCKPDVVDDPIPYVPFPDFNIVISNEPKLQLDGGYIDNRSEGVRGLIIYRKNSSTYLAFERNCSFQPNDACATVEVHSSSLYMFDPCCGSTFDFDGNPTGNPAWRPLRQYLTSFSPGTNTLTVTDQIK